MIRGGFPITRPGLRVIASISGSLPQGGCSFSPQGRSPYQIVAVDGSIYVAQAPFTSFQKLSGISFSPTAPIVNFQVCIKAVQTNPDGSKTIIQPKAVVIIQDGTGAGASWDGVTAKQLNPLAIVPETPIGLWMAWASDRLWIARGSQVFVSDIDDPEAFTENVYLAQRSNFALPDDCTGMVQTADQQTLLVFTAKTTTAFQSNIRDRTQWQTTLDFQRIIMPNIGCVAGRTASNQYSLAQWFSMQGLVSLDGALYSQRTAKVTVLDFPMLRSKSKLAPDLSRMVTASIENLLLVSAPVADRWNSETWVRDQTPVAPGSGDMAEVWAGVWTGVRPVAWMPTIINGRERQFFLSYDKTTKDGTNIHVWEAFRYVRDDNGGGIQCQFETGAIKQSMNQDFKFAELDLTEIEGDVSLQVYVGTLAGPWRKILDTNLETIKGPINTVDTYSVSKIYTNYKPQSRTVRTEQFIPQDKATTPETNISAGTGKVFQLLVQWRGRMAIRDINLFIDPNTKYGMAGRVFKSEAGAGGAIDEGGNTIAL